MATTYKVLGQVVPAVTTNTNLYTVPAGTQAVVSTLAITNLGISTTFRVAVRPGGATIANQHYIVYDAAIDQGNSSYLTIGLTLGAGDIVTVYSGTSTLAFSLFGSEVS